MTKPKFAMQVILLIVLGVILTKINQFFDFLYIPNPCNIRDISYDFFTINSVMAGFSFTVLGILFSFGSKSFVKKLKGTNIIINKAGKIIKTMIFMGMSGLSSLIIVIFKYFPCFNYIFVISLVFMVTGFIYFINSMYSIYDLIRKIHIFDKQGGKSKFEIQRKHKTFSLNENDDTW